MYNHKQLIKLSSSVFTLTAVIILSVVLLRFFLSEETNSEPENSHIIVSEDGVIIQETEEQPAAQKKIRERFTDLRKEYNNDDIIGYLSIDNTPVSYPVVQSADNDYYLSRDIYKKESPAGWIFLDYENNVYTLNRNTIIYGHNMKSGEMFHSLRNYADEDYYKEHRFIRFDTLYEDYVWEVFAFGKVPVSLNYLEVSPPQARFAELVDNLLKFSMYDTGVRISPVDKILNLSTCSELPGEADYRYVLSAKLVND